LLDEDEKRLLIKVLTARLFIEGFNTINNDIAGNVKNIIEKTTTCAEIEAILHHIFTNRKIIFLNEVANGEDDAETAFDYTIYIMQRIGF